MSCLRPPKVKDTSRYLAAQPRQPEPFRLAAGRPSTTLSPGGVSFKLPKCPKGRGIAARLLETTLSHSLLRRPNGGGAWGTMTVPILEGFREASPRCVGNHMMDSGSQIRSSLLSPRPPGPDSPVPLLVPHTPHTQSLDCRAAPCTPKIYPRSLGATRGGELSCQRFTGSQ